MSKTYKVTNKWSYILKSMGFNFDKSCVFLPFQQDVKYEKYEKILNWNMQKVPKELITDGEDCVYVTSMTNN